MSEPSQPLPKAELALLPLVHIERAHATGGYMRHRQLISRRLGISLCYPPCKGSLRFPLAVERLDKTPSRVRTVLALLGDMRTILDCSMLSRNSYWSVEDKAHLVQHSINETTGFFCAILLRNFDRFVNGDNRRNLRAFQHLIDGYAEDVAINGRNAC